MPLSYLLIQNITPKRTSSLQHANKRSSVGSLLDRTRSVISKRASQPQEQPSIGGLHSIYDEDEDDTGEPIPKAPRLTSEYFSRYEIMTEL